ncbi:MAG TPA: tetratricopeptide repeat-containing sensor histidine kinase [Pelobium sp.]|nr:tetratricopeptide repeat-containing sensor histidine kinase [Pelobium sp.]
MTTLLCCYLLITPLITNAFQNENKVDSVKLEAVLTTLKGISPNNVDSIVNYTDQQIQYFKAANQDVALRKLMQTAGFVLSKYSYYGLSEKYYLEAVSIAKKSNNKFAQVDITNSLGVLAGKMGDFVRAEALFLQALLLAKKGNYHEGIAASYFKLSTVRIRQERIDEAFDFCLKADSVNKINNTHFFEIDLLNNKAIVYAIRGDLEKALELFRKGYSVALNDKNETYQISALQNIGLVYKDKGDFDKALSYLHKGLELANKSGLISEGLRVAVNIPVVLVAKKQYNQAVVKLKEILIKAKEQKLDDLVLEVYRNLVDIAKTQDNYKEAFGYFTEYSQLKDKQINEQKQRALQEASVSLGLYRANQELVEMDNLLFQKNRERNIIFGILLFVAILMGFLVFILFRLRKMNLRLNVQKTLLTESNNIKNKLFSIIGHDLRGHQGTTLGILNLIRDGDLSQEETQLYLNMMIKQSQSALTTLEDLLLWGRAHIKGDGHLQSELEISKYIQGAFDLNSEAIHEKKLNVKAVDLENTKVIANSNHFSFIIRNLIANAIKFTPNEGRISVYSRTYNERLLKICVADTGQGLSNDELESIFSPEIVSKRGTNNERGTGLGLILCKEFVEANGGKIWAEQNPEQGTIVCFTCLSA